MLANMGLNPLIIREELQLVTAVHPLTWDSLNPLIIREELQLGRCWTKLDRWVLIP